MMVGVSATRRLLPRHPGLVRRRLRRAHRGPGGGLGGGAGRAARAGRRADRIRQDAGRVPLGAGPAGHRRRRRTSRGTLPGALRVPAQGAGGRRPAQPALPAGRHPAGQPPGSGCRCRTSRSACAPATPRPTSAGVRPHPAGRAGHHAGVAVPDPHLGGPGVAARGADGDRRRGARGRRHQARRAPGAVPGAARRAARPPGAADRAVGHRAPVDEVSTFLAGGRPVEVVQPPIAKTIEVSVEVPVPDLAALDERPAPGQLRRGGDRVRGRHRAAAVDLAGGGAAAAGAGARSTARPSCSPTRGGWPSG